ncbi:MAG: hypothetical protein WA960_05615 [Tunicatimonas sp.]
MKALEFEAELRDNQIRIPDNMQLELVHSKDKSVRVILLIEDSDNFDDDHTFRQLAKEQFLKGYAESDSVYDD